MRTPRGFPQESVKDLPGLLKRASSKSEFQRIQCVWMRVKRICPRRISPT